MINEIRSKIDTTILDIVSKKASRGYLGASSIGEECDRKLWYSYHINKKVDDPRVHRIFELGHMLETYCLRLLTDAGYTLFQDGAYQFGFEDEEIGGHADGVILIDGVYHLLEIKSANDKRFAEMVKDGVERSNPTYFVQMQTYMHYMELDSSLFFAINKNTCEIHMEIVKYEKLKSVYAINRGKEIIRGKEEEAQRKYQSKAFFKCKWCDYKSECWNNGTSEPTQESLDSFKLGENFLLPK